MSEIPFLGIIAKDNYVEYYDFEVAKRNDFHHSFCLSHEGLIRYDRDDTLRFYFRSEKHGNGEKDEIVIEGNPALDPFHSGEKQLKKMAELFVEAGVDDSVPIYVENHYLNTRYEGKRIATLKSFYNPARHLRLE